MARKTLKVITSLIFLSAIAVIFTGAAILLYEKML